MADATRRRWSPRMDALCEYLGWVDRRQQDRPATPHDASVLSAHCLNLTAIMADITDQFTHESDTAEAAAIAAIMDQISAQFRDLASKSPGSVTS